MLVYPHEIEDGLADLVSSSASISLGCQIKNNWNEHAQIKSLVDDSIKKSPCISYAKKNDIDLYPIYTVLVTTGFNANDDVFEREEVWRAKDTPEDKPINIEHSPSEIVGHITGSWPVTLEYRPITSNNPTEWPQQFHILNSSVIYRHITKRDENLWKKTHELIESIARGEWYVSMECLFSDFDYALIDNNKVCQVVRRNAATAFLTKYLRAFGGKGVYSGRRIGRVLRSITFIGKGLTKKPANPNSIIFGDVQPFVGTFANCKVKDGELLFSEAYNISEKTGMSDSNDRIIKQLESQNAEAQKEIKELRDRLNQLGEERVQSEFAALKAKIEEKDREIGDRDKKIVELTASVNNISKEKEGLAETKEKLEKELQDIKLKLQEQTQQLIKAFRVSALVNGGLEKADAEAVVDNTLALNDEQFDVVAQTQIKAFKNQASTNTAQEQDEEVDEVGERVAESTDLSHAEEEADSNDMNTEFEPSEELQETRAALVSWFEKALQKSREK